MVVDEHKEALVDGLFPVVPLPIRCKTKSIDSVNHVGVHEHHQLQLNVVKEDDHNSK